MPIVNEKSVLSPRWVKTKEGDGAQNVTYWSFKGGMGGKGIGGGATLRRGPERQSKPRGKRLSDGKEIPS